MIRAALIGVGISATVVITAALAGIYADRRNTSITSPRDAGSHWTHQQEVPPCPYSLPTSVN